MTTEIKPSADPKPEPQPPKTLEAPAKPTVEAKPEKVMSTSKDEKALMDENWKFIQEKEKGKPIVFSIIFRLKRETQGA